LIRVEPRSLAVTARSAIAPGFVHDVVATDDGIVVLVFTTTAVMDTFDTWLVDPATARFQRTLGAARGARGVADVRGPGLWVGTYEGEARLVDPGAPDALVSVVTGREPSGVAVGADAVWVALRVQEP
jgi:hypothetical protein